MIRPWYSTVDCTVLYLGSVLLYVPCSTVLDSLYYLLRVHRYIAVLRVTLAVLQQPSTRFRLLSSLTPTGFTIALPVDRAGGGRWQVVSGFFQSRRRRGHWVSSGRVRLTTRTEHNYWKRLKKKPIDHHHDWRRRFVRSSSSSSSTTPPLVFDVVISARQDPAETIETVFFFGRDESWCRLRHCDVDERQK